MLMLALLCMYCIKLRGFFRSYNKDYGRGAAIACQFWASINQTQGKQCRLRKSIQTDSFSTTSAHRYKIFSFWDDSLLRETPAVDQIANYGKLNKPPKSLQNDSDIIVIQPTYPNSGHQAIIFRLREPKIPGPYFLP